MADVLLDRSHGLAGGRRVRLRLARPRDRAGLGELLDRLGLAVEELDAIRLLRCTPGRCLTVAALRWDGTREVLAGVGGLDIASGTHTLLAEDREIAGLLSSALRDNAPAWARRVA